jgi:hypothetical protein
MLDGSATRYVLVTLVAGVEFVHSCFFPWVACAADAKRVSHALWLVTLVADIGLCGRAFSFGSLVQWTLNGRATRCVWWRWSRTLSCAFGYCPWVHLCRAPSMGELRATFGDVGRGRWVMHSCFFPGSFAQWAPDGSATRYVW